MYKLIWKLPKTIEALTNWRVNHLHIKCNIEYYEIEKKIESFNKAFSNFPKISTFEEVKVFTEIIFKIIKDTTEELKEDRENKIDILKQDIKNLTIEFQEITSDKNL